MPPDPKVVVGTAAVVRRGHDLLLLQRGGGRLGLQSDGYGTWGLPGGWLEHGETAGDGARRETEEETGLLVRPVSADGFTTDISPSGFTVVTLFVVCEYQGGEPVNAEPDKHLRVAWMDEGLMIELDLFAPLDAYLRRPR